MASAARSRIAWLRARFAVVSWPREYGGRDATPVQQAILAEELANAGAPPILGRLGVSLLAPVLNVYGSPWQKQTYVENIFFAKPGDYVKATQSVLRSSDQSSAVWLPCAVSPRHGRNGRGRASA